MRGTHGHRRVDSAPTRQERGRVVVRGMELWSDSLDLFGRADAVEFWPSGDIFAVEYKVGVRHGISADLQLCAQTLCLEEMFNIDIPVGYVWYSGLRRKREVAIDSLLRKQTKDVLAKIGELFRERRLPSAPSDERCGQCQLLSHCMPDLVSGSLEQALYITKTVLSCDY
jgi:CRISPR-associated exonuclease Cas4